MVGVIAFSPLMVLLWSRLRERGSEPTTPTKVGLGMLFAASGFAILTAGGLAGADAEFERQKPLRAELRRQLAAASEITAKDQRDARRKGLLEMQAALDTGAFPGPDERRRMYRLSQVAF